MAKSTKSQWDFGELFPPEETRKVLTVADLTSQIRRLLEKQIGQVWVGGEITNLRAQSSGHIYFTIKDTWAQLQCVLFRNEAVANRSLLKDGQKVVLRGELTVYEARGQYQLRVTEVELQGIGALQAAFEKLKLKLQAEGLFSTDRKRPLPRFPQRIGLVTSPTGAAIRDVLHVVERRNPALEIILVPSAVQGAGAANELAAAIRALNTFSAQQTHRPLDLILVTRGGGSLEDLWAFNEEVLARAISESAVPVVSAVGHEIDFTISDFVADVRAATPSAAAEIITEGVYSKVGFVAEAAGWMAQQVRQRIAREQRSFAQWHQRLLRCHPRRRLNDQLQLLDDLSLSLSRCVRRDYRRYFSDWETIRARLARLRPRQVIKEHEAVLKLEHQRLNEALAHRLERLKNRVESLADRLRLLSPDHVLARGYSITMDAQTGAILRTADEVDSGQKIKTRLKRGEIHSLVEPSDASAQ